MSKFFRTTGGLLQLDPDESTPPMRRAVELAVQVRQKSQRNGQNVVQRKNSGGAVVVKSGVGKSGVIGGLVDLYANELEVFHAGSRESFRY